MVMPQWLYSFSLHFIISVSELQALVVYQYTTKQSDAKAQNKKNWNYHKDLTQQLNTKS